MGWIITAPNLEVLSLKKEDTVAYVWDDGRVTGSDGGSWCGGTQALCRIEDDGRIVRQDGLRSSTVGRIGSNGSVADGNGRIMFWIHSSGDICDTYEGGSLARVMGHVRRNGEASGFLGTLVRSGGSTGGGTAPGASGGAYCPGAGVSTMTSEEHFETGFGALKGAFISLFATVWAFVLGWTALGAVGVLTVIIFIIIWLCNWALV